MAYKVKLPTIYLGAAYKKSFLWFTQNQDGVRTPVDLTGMNGRVQLRKKAGDPVLADWSTANGSIVFSDINRITFIVPRSVTDTYNFVEAEWDMLLWEGNDIEGAEVVMYGTVPAQRVKTDLD